MNNIPLTPNDVTGGASPLSETALADLKERLSAATVLRKDEPLSKRTTLRVGGCADLYAEPASEEELAIMLRWCSEHSVPFIILGRGSNLLIRDGGIRGLVICLSHSDFRRIEVTGYRMHCGAGAKMKEVALEARRHLLTGLEFLEGIPGTVGGGLRMNAGAMGGWMFDVVESVRYMDFNGEVFDRDVRDIQVEYRSCPLLKDHIALGAMLKGHPAAREVVDKRMKAFSEKRWESQPSGSSAGCIFKNPETIPAGKLIDELGLKGTRVGDAVVSSEHGNFIVNDGEATAKQVLELIEIIRKKAKAERGIQLETEVEIIGE